MNPPTVSIPETFGTRLADFGGFGPGFDFVRLFLASGVVFWHCFPLTTGTPALIDATPFWFAVSSMVPMFFALSGYLVTASANRIAVGPYLLNRAARILPALACVVLLTAFVLGPLLSEKAVSAYFTDPALWRYLPSMIGLNSYRLPGLFLENPYPVVVNGSLWTVPYEILCYLMMAGLMVTGLVRRWSVLVGLFAALTALAFIGSALAPGTHGVIGALLKSGYFAQGAKIIPYFLLGAVTWLLRDRIPYSNRLALLSVIAVLAVGAVGDPAWRKSPLLWLLLGPPMTYLVVWAGLTRLPKPHFFGGGDFSYGIYLWHFPILQALVLLFGIKSWWLLGLVAALPVLAISALSWHLVEKPVLRWRKQSSAVGARLGAPSQTG